MNFDEIIDRLKTLTGTFGVIVSTDQSDDILNYQAADCFPLASAAKLVLAALTASMVSDGYLSWGIANGT